MMYMKESKIQSCCDAVDILLVITVPAQLFTKFGLIGSFHIMN